MENIQFGYSSTLHSQCRFVPADPVRKSSKRIPRVGKPTTNVTRMQFSQRFWHPIRERLKQRLETHGEATRIARYTGVHPAQIHRYTCPVCEHDQEPQFSVVMSILLYLNTF